jgi:transcriptional regulator of acetoin/glycerol metabolism
VGQRGRALLRQVKWTGNLRQLKNVIEAAAAVTEGDTIRVRDVREFLPSNGCIPDRGFLRRMEAHWFGLLLMMMFFT